MNDVADPQTRSAATLIPRQSHAARTVAFLALFLALARADLTAETRKWTRTDGKTVSAELVMTEGDHVVLKAKGKEFKVNRADLSKEDNEWLTTTATLRQDFEGGVLKPEVDTERAALCLKTGGKPSVYLMSAKLKRIDFKSSDKAILVFEGNIAVAWTDGFLRLDGKTLYRGTSSRSAKQKVISEGETVTLRAKATSTPIGFNLSSIGLDKVWFASNFKWPAS